MGAPFRCFASFVSFVSPVSFRFICFGSIVDPLEKRKGVIMISAYTLVAALESMNGGDVGEFIVSFSPTNHSGSKFVDLTMIGRAGKFIG
jgi:hypothetical protein